MSRVTINDVARASGTSKKTVSRVLNNEPNVRDQVRERVMSAVTRLNYRPLTSARSADQDNEKAGPRMVEMTVRLRW